MIEFSAPRRQVIDASLSPSRGRVSHSSGSANQQRYRRLELLGQGGLCQVYRSVDEIRGEVVALKQLLSAHREKEDDYAQRLFESEYHALKQLQHPSIIEVYEYGVDEEHGPYYTMELLSGSDLQELSPLAWREACPERAGHVAAAIRSARATAERGRGHDGELIYNAGEYPALAAKYKQLLEQEQRAAHAALGKLPQSGLPRERTELSAMRTALASCATLSERADCALSLLCQQAGAERGALFGIRARKLQPITSIFAGDLVELAQAYLNAEIDSSVDAEKTQIDDANDVTLSEAAPGSRGPYQPVVLRVLGEGDERIVGIAILRSQGPIRRVPAPQFVSALSEAMLEAGLVEAVRAAS
jgi:hypothetical protein